MHDDFAITQDGDRTPRVSGQHLGALVLTTTERKPMDAMLDPLLCE
jgi:hypothetical protein